MTTATINAPENKPEAVFYFAEIATEKVSVTGNIVYKTYLFDSLKEAQKSGVEYHIATWEDINGLADLGVFIHDKIVVTPQGKFQLISITQFDDVEDAEVEVDCIYNYVGAPLRLNEAITCHLRWNKGSELQFITDCDGTYTAYVKNADGHVIALDYSI
ncbi:hypothetical protein H1230_13255 [Paenibacillus sp. 19GGS1-52]|uniref:hypothetical protein n=1 Tax=Paenibacillus sp. 19GGS1-52 TaxID=2758563 RepID=UPI001EFA40E6|nr:hypothetical protein [Paenibacillus sp. 19GGS1-52]ULO09648.1 hypothetical protein H1230_13255 [Paenibacillus sp. 19GGS1-52]